MVELDEAAALLVIVIKWMLKYIIIIPQGLVCGLYHSLHGTDTLVVLVHTSPFQSKFGLRNHKHKNKVLTAPSISPP